MAKPHCLVVLSAAPQGIAAQSFIQCLKVLHPVFNIQLASPNGRPPEYMSQDESSQRWLNDFRGKPYSTPVRTDVVDASRYAALLVPDGLGALYDLVEDAHVSSIINHFIRTKKPICAIGSGVAALCRTSPNNSIPWHFAGFCITGMSVLELARNPGFGSLPIILEDFIKQNGGDFTATEPDCPHVVIDRFLITGQNEASAVTAVQNLILLCNQRQSKKSSLSSR